MRWMMLALIPLLVCGAVMIGGLVLAALGVRHLGERSRDNTHQAGDDTYANA